MDHEDDGYRRVGDDDYWELNEADRFIWIHRKLWLDLSTMFDLPVEIMRELTMCFERVRDGEWIKIPRTTWFLLHRAHWPSS